MSETLQALFLDENDSVATLLAEAPKGAVVILKGHKQEITALDTIPYGHKIAVKNMNTGDPVMKYGQRIGLCTKPVQKGEWIHLHNMASGVDLSFSERIDTCSNH